MKYKYICKYLSFLYNLKLDKIFLGLVKGMELNQYTHFHKKYIKILKHKKKNTNCAPPKI